MIDIHSHILPEIDDGAHSVEEAVEMAKIALKNGTTDMFLTPHCNIPGLYKNHKSELLLERIAMFKEILEHQNIPLNLYDGMEVFATDDIFLQLQTDRYLTLNGSRYLLVEFDFREDCDWTSYILEGLVQRAIVPVVAHPERYYFTAQRLSVISDWIDIGCKIQINRNSIMGAFGKSIRKFSHNLIKNNMVDFVASDAHSATRRTPRLNDAFYTVSEEFGKEVAGRLFLENPKRIILDETF